jgi:hypothetical protein
MATVLLVNHSRDLADAAASWLTARGHKVLQCPGPGKVRCPILDGRTCYGAEQADVLVYDAWSSGGLAGDKELIFGLRQLHPDRPLVLTAPGLEPDWGPLPGEEDIFVVPGLRSARQLTTAVESALAARRPTAATIASDAIQESWPSPRP